MKNIYFTVSFYKDILNHLEIVVLKLMCMYILDIPGELSCNPMYLLLVMLFQYIEKFNNRAADTRDFGLSKQ